MSTRSSRYLLPLAIALGALLPAEARSQCEQWQLGNFIDVIQGSFNIRLSFSKQRENQFTGTASYYYTQREKLNGEIEGSLVGDTFELTAFWDNGSVGLYHGTVTPQGRLFGETVDKAHPNLKQAWHSYQNLKCPNPNKIEAKPPDVIEPGLPVKSKPRDDMVLVAPSFAGTWDSVTGDGANYTLSLDSQGDGSVGAVDPKLNGTMNGTLSSDGKSMSFVMTQPSAGITSRGELKLTGGGNAFDGRLTKDTDGKPQTFKGTRRK